MNFLHDHNWWARVVGHYIRDLVLGANDGIITTFAVVAGVRGAELSSLAILALGFANLAADGFSMAIGNFLGIKSEEAVVNGTGYRNWPSAHHAAKHGVATWIAFTLAGLIPLLPYLAPGAATVDERFWVSAAITGLALFFVGATRTWVTMRSAFWSGVEMLLVGAVAGILAFLAGMVIARIQS